MEVIEVGFFASRNPDGSFNDAVPIYVEATPEIRAEIEKISLKSFRKLRSTISAAIGQRLKFLSTGNTNVGIRRKKVRRKKARK